MRGPRSPSMNDSAAPDMRAERVWSRPSPSSDSFAAASSTASIPTVEVSSTVAPGLMAVVTPDSENSTSSSWAGLRTASRTTPAPAAASRAVPAAVTPSSVSAAPVDSMTCGAAAHAEDQSCRPLAADHAPEEWQIHRKSGCSVTPVTETADCR